MRCNSITLNEVENMSAEERAEQEEKLLKRPGVIQVPQEIRNQIAQALVDKDDEEGRKANLTIHNLEEITGTDQQRIDHDIAEVKKIFEICEVPVSPTDFTTVERRGPKPKAGDHRQRITVVKLVDVEKKRHLLKNMQKFRDYQLAHRPAGDAGELNDQLPLVRVDHDMSRNQRDTRRSFLQAAHRKSEDDPFYKYKVRGPPWKLELYRVPKSLPQRAAPMGLATSPALFAPPPTAMSVLRGPRGMTPYRFSL